MSYTMNLDKQRLLIAGACGWAIWDAASPDGITKWRHPNHPYGWRETNGLPDYTNDLNAMHEAVASLEAEQKAAFVDALLAICPKHVMHCFSDFAALNATAAHRAEAFLRAIGKWEDA